MKKSKRKPLVLTEPKEQRPIDPALIKNVNALKALVTTHSLLNEGLFPKPSWPAVHECQEFIKSLHAQLTAEAISHADCDRLEELRILKENQSVQV